MASTFADINAHGVAVVAAALGLTVPEDAVRRGLGPCPACGAPTRHTRTSDPRGALGLTRDGHGWRCFQCDAHGDAVSLAALVACGTIPAKGSDQWRAVVALCAAHGLCEALQGGSGAVPAVRRPPPIPRAAPAPVRPPTADLAGLWARCRPVTEDHAVRDYLLGRGFRAARLDAIAAEDLARALPRDADPLPAWCRRGAVAWPDAGYRLVFPLVDASGTLASVQARHLGTATPKYLSPTGYAVAGLVAASPAGRAMLAGTHTPARVVITEGMTDYLTAATHPLPAPEAVVSVMSGSWSATMAERIPSGLVVIVATDADDAGHRYFEAVRQTLAARCPIRRMLTS